MPSRARALIASGSAAMTELWKPVEGYEGLYSISDAGRVRAERSGKLMALVPNSDGYPTVNLYRDGKPVRFRVHRVVCRAFHGEPFADAHAAHLDGDKTNARAENLAWTTRQENADHKRLHGTHYVQPPREAMPRGENHPHAKLSDAAVSEIRRRRTAGEQVSDLATEFGVSQQHVYLLMNGQRRASPPSRVSITIARGPQK